MNLTCPSHRGVKQRGGRQRDVNNRLSRVRAHSRTVVTVRDAIVSRSQESMTRYMRLTIAMDGNRLDLCVIHGSKRPLIFLAALMPKGLPELANGHGH